MGGEWYIKPARFVAIVGLSFVLLGSVLVWLGMSAVPAQAATLNVSATTGNNTPACGSVGAPCLTIAYALTQHAIAGDVVFVWAGTYSETFSMEQGVIISGSGVATTIIEGNGTSPVVSASGSTITDSAVIRDVTIRGGSASNGGGLSITGGASPVIKDCIVSNNQATSYGGGIYINASSPTISDTRVLSNTAGRGGGIYVVSGASSNIHDIELRNNQASGTGSDDGGGGLYVDGSLTLTATQFISNGASHHGGGLYQYGSSGSGWVTLVGGRLERNVASGSGGGMYASGNAAVTGTLVISNTAAGVGGGLSTAHNVVFTGVQVISNTAGTWGGGLYQNSFDDQVRITGGRFERNRSMATVILGGGGLFASSRAIMTGVVVINNVSEYWGGGILLAVGGVLTDVQVVSNTARLNGGGLFHRDTPDTGTWVDLVGGSFERNAATSGNGGGLYSNGNMSLTGTQVLTNSAGGWGGGLYVGGGSGHITDTIDFTNMQIVSNTASTGGGLYHAMPAGRVDGAGGRFERNVATASGGAMYIAGTTALTGTQVLNNEAGHSGGGLYIGGNALLTEVVATGNRAARSGGGLYAGSSTGRRDVIGGRFEHNVAVAPNPWQGGGGLYAWGAIVLTGTQVTNNSAGGRGGGGLYGERAVQISNSLFAANVASDGAGIRLQGTAGAQTLRHVTVVSATVAGSSAIYVYTGTVGITNTIIANHTTGIRHVDGTLSEDYDLYFDNGTDVNSTGGTFNSGANSVFDQDPRFIDPAAGLFRIDTDSAALDAGTFLGLASDMDGDARPTNPARPDAPDIGCDENKNFTVRRPLTDTMTFGAACARLVFTDTGSLGSQDYVTITVVPGQFPTLNPSDNVVSRTVGITLSNSATVSATLALCYEQDEVAGGLTESQFQLYRWAGYWEVHPSIVDTTNNVVTGTKITAYSAWVIGSSGPTAVVLRSFQAGRAFGTPGLLWVLPALVLTGAMMVRLRRRKS